KARGSADRVTCGGKDSVSYDECSGYFQGAICQRKEARHISVHTLNREVRGIQFQYRGKGSPLVNGERADISSASSAAEGVVGRAGESDVSSCQISSS